MIIFHLGFVKFIFLTVELLRDPFCISIPNFVKIGQTVADRNFSHFHDGGRRHLGFSKIQNFNV